MRRLESKSARSCRAGFTLVEMLVVIGIIILLVGILVPTVMSARRAADKNACRMELHTIAIALDAYKADFGDYPRPPSNIPKNRQYRLLAWALLGPYGMNNTTPTDPLGSGPLTDGADGPGFRTVFDKTTGKGGKVWGPYLPDKFQVTSTDVSDPTGLKWDIMDRYGSPIEYYPRWRTYKTGMHLFGDATSDGAAVYDYRQQYQANPAGTPSSTYSAIQYFRRALGDNDLSDVYNGSETPGEMPPFLLISRGPYRQFSTDADIKANFAKCDEITNLQH